jgi:uncharacterized peroxidase-related enzyme
MPRLNVIDPKSADGKVKKLFDGPLNGKHLNIFKGMANSPAALNAYLALSEALEDGLLTLKEREVISLALAEANDCGYCRAAHTFVGKQAGLTEQETVAARQGRLSDTRLNALAQFTQRLTEKRGFVSDKDLGDLRAAGYGDGHIAEAVAVYALNTYTNYFNHVNETDVDLPAAPPLP